MNEFKNYENTNEIELDGFAENEDAIDGGYDEIVPFNYSLAYDYYWTFKIGKDYDIISFEKSVI